jgi:SAM-dependent methyltransferase
MSDYILGASDLERDRLAFQHEVWSPVTERFLDRLGSLEGASVLDAGAGPGFVLESLIARVGPSGRVVALDESPRWIAHLERTRAARGWTRVEIVRSRIESAPLAPSSFDLAFARWVLSFPPRPDACIAALASALKPGGLLAIEDYNHEGISLFPDSAGFRAVVRATRAWYASKGGDVWIAGRLPALARAAGLEPVEITPSVLAGGPDSPAFRWASAFFPHHSQSMVDAGLLSPDERALFLREWEERTADPSALFFSPIVVDFAARKPA